MSITRTAVEGTEITLRAHLILAWTVALRAPGSVSCLCGWEAPVAQLTTPQVVHARHVAEQLAAVGALGGAGEIRTQWGIRWPDTSFVDPAANEEIARDAVTGKQATHYGAVAVSRRVSEWTEVVS